MHVVNTVNMNSDTEWAKRRDFANSVSINTICDKKDFALHLAGAEFLESVAGIAQSLCTDGKVKIIGQHPGCHEITVSGITPALIQITTGGLGFYEDEARHNFSVFVTGTSGFVSRLFAGLREKYGDSRLATVSWWFKGGHGGADCRTVPIEPPLPIYNEFYPWIEGGVEPYLDRFMRDRASILFMMGPPGTGKTSLLRHLIYSRQLAATITYEEELLGTDTVFVNFLCNPDPGILVVEDADLMVGSRESEGNKLISRFLNVSDGLIKTSGKKIIFTTNLGDFRHVDSALIRSGRCFDALRFRALAAEEALSAAKAAGITLRSYEESTLSDLFSLQPSGTLELSTPGFRL